MKQGVQTVASRIVMPPNASPTEFPPLHRSLFGDATATLALSDGVPTKFEQSADSEVIASSATPAKVLDACFGAIGAASGKRSAAASKEAATIVAIHSLAAAQARQDRCLQAIASGSQADVTQLCR